MKLSYILELILIFCLAHSVYGEEIDIGRIIAIESSGNPNAIGKAGEIGLMQITLSCYKDWEQHQPFIYKDPKVLLYNPEWNVIIGTYYINERIPQLLKAYGIEDTVTNRIIAYSWGISNLRKYLKGERKLPKSVKAYLRKYKEK